VVESAEEDEAQEAAEEPAAGPEPVAEPEPAAGPEHADDRVTTPPGPTTLEDGLEETIIRPRRSFEGGDRG
ncbi:hypothetical protein SB775_33410, partial [Peribacillus sp. SIMBA_075]